ncbi:hypothetical protein ACGFOM_24615 [Streptomyces sp. NPDC048594]|uniref:hypothetical protein n=1 Tax=Streptomyces sp. NPDC048594 TaxID=3365575 RepID=UPI00371E542D
MTSKPVLWTGVGLCGAGAVTLVVVAFVDLGRADQAASVTGAIAGLAGLALALFGRFGGTSSPPLTPGTTASGDGAIAAGGNIGTASTGGTTAPPPPPSPTPPPSSTPPNGGVNASGRGSIAAGGDIGSASTGN